MWKRWRRVWACAAIGGLIVGMVNGTPTAQAAPKQGILAPIEGYGVYLAGLAAAAAGAEVAHSALQNSATSSAAGAEDAARRNTNGSCGKKCKRTRRYARNLKRAGGGLYRWAKQQGHHTVKKLARWFGQRFGGKHVKKTVLAAVRGCVGWGVFDFLVIHPNWDTARNGCLGGGAASVVARRKGVAVVLP